MLHLREHVEQRNLPARKRAVERGQHKHIPDVERLGSPEEERLQGGHASNADTAGKLGGFRLVCCPSEHFAVSRSSDCKRPHPKQA